MFKNIATNPLTVLTAIAVLAAIAHTEPALSIASGTSTESRSKPNSYAPQPHTNRHVYGAPIEPAIVGHAKTSHHKRAHTKASTRTTQGHDEHSPGL